MIEILIDVLGHLANYAAWDIDWLNDLKPSYKEQILDLKKELVTVTDELVTVKGELVIVKGDLSNSVIELEKLNASLNEEVMKVNQGKYIIDRQIHEIKLLDGKYKDMYGQVTKITTEKDIIIAEQNSKYNAMYDKNKKLIDDQHKIISEQDTKYGEVINQYKKKIDEKDLKNKELLKICDLYKGEHDRNREEFLDVVFKFKEKLSLSTDKNIAMSKLIQVQLAQIELLQGEKSKLLYELELTKKKD